ncbi:hypothetical protein BDC45DRAFT_497938 [Circinella umbellata]|nr:hypothetical protein BDC45DRAFT_497938 [Circinella umbellata]
MSSSLTFQLRQQEEQDVSTKHLGPAVSLPSPPNSSYGDEASVANADSSKEQERRDSLPTHFNALTLEHFSTSLPENYTIEHSSSPIPIQQSSSSTSSSSSSHNHNHTHNHHHQHHHHRINNNSKYQQRAESPIFHHHLSSPTATAAATGGRTIRNNNINHNNNNSNNVIRHKFFETTVSTSLPINYYSNCGPIRKSPASMMGNAHRALHRCDDCGKVYKHPSCLAKHRWEHSDEWELTSKLLLTKHQQVQMLEAAAILVSLDTKRAEQEEDQVVRNQDHQQFLNKRDHEIDEDDEDDDENDDDDEEDDDESIRIDDDDDLIDMDMEEEEELKISTTSSSSNLLAASYPHRND